MRRSWLMLVAVCFSGCAGGPIPLVEGQRSGSGKVGISLHGRYEPTPQPVATDPARDEVLRKLRTELALAEAQSNALRMAIASRTADGQTTRDLLYQLDKALRELSDMQAASKRLQVERDALLESTTDIALVKLLDQVALRLNTTHTETPQATLTLGDEPTGLASALVQSELDGLRIQNRLLAEKHVAALKEKPGTLLARLAENQREMQGLQVKMQALQAKAAELQEQNQRLAADNATLRSQMKNKYVVVSGGAVLSLNAVAPPKRYHIVAEGDTPATISSTYYGDPSRWREIMDANQDVLGDSLVVGRTIRIP